LKSWLFAFLSRSAVQDTTAEAKTRGDGDRRLDLGREAIVVLVVRCGSGALKRVAIPGLAERWNGRPLCLACSLGRASLSLGCRIVIREFFGAGVEVIRLRATLVRGFEGGITGFDFVGCIKAITA
jgi:hypothetical protein